jgi:hypothetical protein
MLLEELFQEVCHVLPYAMKWTTSHSGFCKNEPVQDRRLIGAPLRPLSQEVAWRQVAQWPAGVYDSANRYVQRERRKKLEGVYPFALITIKR